MLRQLLVGTAISVCNIAIHALVMATVVHMSSRIAGAKDTVRQSRWQDRFDRSKMTHLRHRGSLSAVGLSASTGCALRVQQNVIGRPMSKLHRWHA